MGGEFILWVFLRRVYGWISFGEGRGELDLQRLLRSVPEAAYNVDASG